MEKPAIEMEVLNERQQVSRMVVLGMCVAVIAWLFITVAQGVLFCGSMFLGFKR